jgi:hypothetical protein
MLVVKCPQCDRSYRLAESLYRRKAAGYGVVITCRHCKTQIHVDEGSLPPPAGNVDGTATETQEGDTANPPHITESEAETRSDPDAADEPITNRPAAAVDAATNPAPAGTPQPAVNLKAADAHEVAAAVAEIEAAVDKMDGTPAAPNADTPSGVDNPALPPVADNGDPAPSPVLPDVAPKPAPFAARAAGIPRPAGSPPRPGGSATATPMPAGATATPMPVAAMPLVTKKPHVEAASSPGTPKPKLVALSPGLLGIGTALKDPSPKLASTNDQSRNANAPMSVPDSALFEVDAEPLSQPPDSAMPIDTLDYVESAPLAPAPPKPPPREPPKRDGSDAKAKTETPAPDVKHERRLPTAPPMRNQHARATAGEAKPGEIPSESGTPKMAELSHDASPAQLSQKKGEPPKRKRQPSGDLTDDLLSTDIGFDAPPALAPPDADALTRAPVSSRRPSATVKPESVEPGANATTKAPVSTSTTTKEKTGSGRGFTFFLLVAAVGGGMYFFRDRLVPEVTPEPPPQAAVNAPAVNEPEPAPAPVAPAPATVAEPAGSAAAPEASAAAPAAAATTPTANATAATVVPTTKAATPRPEAVTAAAPADKQTTAPTSQSTAAAPTSTTAVEPRGAAGTEPFDVAAARSALDVTAGQASGCRKPGDPSGVAVVTITFSQTGRVTTANISGPPFQATPTGGCIASTMRKTRIPAFAGDMVTVRKTITVQ